MLEGTDAWTLKFVHVRPRIWVVSRSSSSWVVSRTLWSGKVYHIPILLEHVDLFNCLDRLDVEFLQRRLQLLVVGA